MAGIKIENLVDGGGIQTTDDIPVGRGGDTRRVRIGTAGAADLTTSAKDTTAGRAMATGLGGLGTISPLSVSDFDAHAEAGFWKTSSSSQAEMPLSGNFKVLQFNFDSNAATQISHRADGAGPYIRNKSGGTWDGTWENLYRQGTIVGTVSQSGGTPTGRIIEQGSNSNGEYTKFADGTMICRVQQLSVSFGNSDYLSGTWTYPATFVLAPVLMFNTTPATADGASVFRKAGTIGSAGEGTTSTQIRVSAISGNDWVSGDELTQIRGYAIGRWF